ncbi:MAG: peptide ligase PGM1-related protein [Actinomycetota bacterium]
MSSHMIDDGGTLVVCPSISFPAVELRKITGIQHYEERLLFVSLRLRDPGMRLVYITSMPIDPEVVDYYLGFLPEPDDARRRLHLVTVGDPEPRALSAKLLERRDLIDRIRVLAGDPSCAYLLPFNVTSWEAALADLLGLRVFGPRPELSPLGSKSGARRLARAAGVDVVDGEEDLWSVEAIEEAVSGLLRRRAGARAVVIKLNNGFSGQGNAILEAGQACSPLQESPITFCAAEESWSSFERKIASGGAVIEELIRLPGVTSPSVQMCILPGGEVQLLSTHDQILGGPDDQVYLGCRFPARPEYRSLIQELGLRIADALAGRGVVGPFGVDFLVAPDGDGRRAYLSEINLRMGGTTHPFTMAQLITGGAYEPSSGELTVDGDSVVYLATDNLKSDGYVGLKPRAVMDAVAASGLAFDASSRSGVTLHLLGALPRFGKFGAMCLGSSHEQCDDLYRALVTTIEDLVE